MGDQRLQDLEQRRAAGDARVALCAYRPGGSTPPRDLGDHGVQIRPLYAWSGYRTNEVFFSDVRVPLSNLIGELNQGWAYITGALDLERGALTNAGDMHRAVGDLVALARQPRRDGTVPADNPAFCRRLAQAEADVEAA